MDKKKTFAKFKSDPKFEKMLEFIREDRNWFYDLYELVNKRVKHFFKLSYFANNYLENELSLFIFGSILITISETNEKKFLTNLIPVRNKYSTNEQIKTENGGKVLYMIALDRFDNRRLILNSVNTEINRYLRLANIFIENMKVDESIVRDEFLALFKEKNQLEVDLKYLYSKNIFSDKTIYSKTNKDDHNQIKPGRKPQYDSKESLLNAIVAIPKTSYKSQTQLAELLGMSESNLRELKKKYSLDLSKI